MDRRKLLTWCEVDYRALVHNAKTVLGTLPRSCLLAPVVKANGYGHGMEIAARAFVEGGARWLCVETAEDALRLYHQTHIGVPIYIIGMPPADLDIIREAIDYGARFSVGSERDVQHIASAWSVDYLGSRGPAPVHLKLDTGFGVGPYAFEAYKLANEIRRLPPLRLEGVSTHYVDANDNPDSALKQLIKFNEFCEQLSATLPNDMVLLRHCTNSASVLRQLSPLEALARVGIAVYGIWESLALCRAMDLDLRPAFSWKARITGTKFVPAGEGVGYAHSFKAQRTSLIGTLPIGYSDGLDRRLSNGKGFVLLPDCTVARIVGRVSMNMAFVDLTDVPLGIVEPGTVVTVVGKLPTAGVQPLSPECVAELCGTIPQEIVTRIAAHIPRVEV